MENFERLVVALFLFLSTCSGSWTELAFRIPEPVLSPFDFPRRSAKAPSGSEFLNNTKNMTKKERERETVKEILSGNMPDFCRLMVPIKIRMGKKRGRMRWATLWVSANYLAIGSNEDYVIAPMNFYSATEIARKSGFLLPTRKIVDHIYRQASHALEPKPLPPGPLMETNVYFIRHQTILNEQFQSIPQDALVAGHKKDVVISNILNRRPKRLAIFGWHRAKGAPIQPLSTAHHAGYADYSHGVRLINPLARLDGEIVQVKRMLNDPEYHHVLSDEGPMPKLDFWMAGYELKSEP